MRIAVILAGVLSLLAIADLPIGYYTFLRIYLTIISVLLCIREYSVGQKINGKVILFGVIAILFNPIIPVYLHDKELWSIIDFIVGVILLITGFRIKEEGK